jgi:proteasome accessory factor B
MEGTVARGKQLTRILNVLRLLGRAGGSTFREIADELGVTERTARRDLEALLDANLPVHELGEDRPKRWHVGNGLVPGSGLQFNAQELLAIVVALERDVAFGDAAHASTLEHLRLKLRTVVPRPVIGRADDLGLRSTFVQATTERTLTGWGEKLSAFIDRREEIELRYSSRDSDDPRTRRVEPLAIAHSRSGAYLLAKDVVREDLRRYRLKRITGAQGTGRRFKGPEDAEVGRLLGSSVGIHGGAVETFVVRFTKKAAEHVRENPWHSSQQLIEGADGTTLLRFTASGRVEVKSKVQSFGADAALLEPPDLARVIALEAARVWAAYLRVGRRSRQAAT